MDVFDLQASVKIDTDEAVKKLDELLEKAKELDEKVSSKFEVGIEDASKNVEELQKKVEELNKLIEDEHKYNLNIDDASKKLDELLTKARLLDREIKKEHNYDVNVRYNYQGTPSGTPNTGNGYGYNPTDGTGLPSGDSGYLPGLPSGNGGSTGSSAPTEYYGTTPSNLTGANNTGLPAGSSGENTGLIPLDNNEFSISGDNPSVPVDSIPTLDTTGGGGEIGGGAAAAAAGSGINAASILTSTAVKVVGGAALTAVLVLTPSDTGDDSIYQDTEGNYVDAEGNLIREATDEEKEAAASKRAELEEATQNYWDAWLEYNRDNSWENEDAMNEAHNAFEEAFMSSGFLNGEDWMYEVEHELSQRMTELFLNGFEDAEEEITRSTGGGGGNDGTERQALDADTAFNSLLDDLVGTDSRQAAALMMMRFGSERGESYGSIEDVLNGDEYQEELNRLADSLSPEFADFLERNGKSVWEWFSQTMEERLLEAEAEAEAEADDTDYLAFLEDDPDRLDLAKVKAERERKAEIEAENSEYQQAHDAYDGQAALDEIISSGQAGSMLMSEFAAMLLEHSWGPDDYSEEAWNRAGETMQDGSYFNMTVEEFLSSLSGELFNHGNTEDTLTRGIPQETDRVLSEGINGLAQLQQAIENLTDEEKESLTTDDFFDMVNDLTGDNPWNVLSEGVSDFIDFEDPDLEATLSQMLSWLEQHGSGLFKEAEEEDTSDRLGPGRSREKRYSEDGKGVSKGEKWIDPELLQPLQNGIDWLESIADGSYLDGLESSSGNLDAGSGAGYNPADDTAMSAHPELYGDTFSVTELADSAQTHEARQTLLLDLFNQMNAGGMSDDTDIESFINTINRFTYMGQLMSGASGDGNGWLSPETLNYLTQIVNQENDPDKTKEDIYSEHTVAELFEYLASQGASLFNEYWTGGVQTVPEVEDDAGEEISDQIGDVIVDIEPLTENGNQEVQDQIGTVVVPVVLDVDTSALNGLSILNNTDTDNLPGHASGLDYVPTDDYPALLHRGEKVLTAYEAEQYRDGSYGSGNLDTNALVNGIIGAIQSGMADATVNNYLNGKNLSSESNKETIRQVKARRFAS